MRLFGVVTLLAGCLLVVSVRAQRITTVDPLSAKAGDTVNAKGEGLDKAAVNRRMARDEILNTGQLAKHALHLLVMVAPTGRLIHCSESVMIAEVFDTRGGL